LKRWAVRAGRGASAVVRGGVLILFYIIGRIGRLDMEREMRLHLGGWYVGVRRLPAGEKGRRHHSSEAVSIV
jgi:hypothetical protein